MTTNGSSDLRPNTTTSTDSDSDEVDRASTATADEDILDEIKKWESDAKMRPLVLVTAGKAGVGKSTLVNTFLGLKSKTAAVGLQVDAVTKVVDTYEEKVHGITVRVVDTPGFASQNVSEEKTMAELLLQTGGKADLLLYCLSLASRYDERDERIIRTLKTAFGKEIWERAILVLTFGDFAFKKVEDKYKLLKGYTDCFQEMLAKAQIKIPVSPILPSQESSAVNVGIVGIPVGETLEAPQYWGQLLFREVIKKCDKDAIPALFELQQIPLKAIILSGFAGAALGVVGGGVAGGGIGATLGSAFGAIVGSVGAGVGAVPGAAAGAAIGAQVGAVIGAGGIGGLGGLGGGIYLGMNPDAIYAELTVIKKILRARAKLMAEEKEKKKKV